MGSAEPSVCLQRDWPESQRASQHAFWLYIDFHEQNIPKSVVLRMDKKEYKNIFVAVKTHTGKEVEFLGDAKDKSKKERNEKEHDK